MIDNIFLGLKFAFSYFSLLPVKFTKEDDLFKKEVLSSMLFFLPFVGAVIAGISFLPYYLLHNLLFLVVSAVLFEILTGFIHLEAVIDVVDALFAKMSGKDAYKVIKEPTVGAIGVLWGVAIFILKVAGYSYLLYLHRYFEIIMIAFFSRAILLFLIYTYEFRSEFLNSLKGALNTSYLFLLFGFGIKIIFLLPLGFFITWWLGKMLGFKNGDVLGATLEIVEIVGFLIIGAGIGI